MESIQHDEQITPIEEAMPAMTKRYYEARPQRAVASERKESMQVRSWNTPAHWGDVLDGDAATYLTRLVSFEGTQSRRDGYVSDSRENIRTGPKGLGRRYSDHVQRRIERDLRRLGLIETRPGWHRETMARPNMELIKAWNHYLDYDEAVLAVLEGRWTDTESAPPTDGMRTPGATESVGSSYGKRSMDLRKAQVDATESARLNTPTPYTPDTHSQRAPARPEPETERKEEIKERVEVSPKISKSVEVLSDIEGIGDPRMLTRLVETLAEKYPTVDPVNACKKYPDVVAKAAADNRPVRSHRVYLEGHFEREAASVEAEAPNPFGTDYERVKDKPRAARVYQAFYGGAVEDYEAMIQEGFRDSEIIEIMERRSA